MSEKESGFIINRERQERMKPNFLRDFDACVDAVIAIEGAITNRITSEERRGLRQKMSNAFAQLEEQLVLISDEDREKFGKRVISGFEGLDGFNRYSVRGDGSIGLARSHSIDPCIKKAQELGIDTPEFMGM